jgi:hypothetical protein
MAEKSNHRLMNPQNAKDKNRADPEPAAEQAVPAIGDMLAAKLKAYYGEIASQPIPERLMALMAELEAQTAEKPRAEPGSNDGNDP